MARRMFSVAVCALVLSWVSPASTASQSVEDLIAKNLQAKGGLERIKAIQSIRQTGHMTMQGLTAQMVVYLKRPNLLRQEITVGGQTMVNAFDGTTPWMVNPLAGSTAPIAVTGATADAIRDQADFDGPLVDYKAKGYIIELVGPDTVDGRSVQHLKLIGRNGQVQQCYLDSETGLEARIVSQSQAGEIEQDLSDYRDVEGVKVPFASKAVSRGIVMATIAVDKVEFNVTLDPNLFKMPGKTASSRPAR